METAIQIPDNLALIAAIVRKNWQKIYFGAEPYLKAMTSLNSIHDQYLEDSAKSIITYFLANAQTWRGPVARAVKAKLNSLLASAK
ncbi:hypothetical protein [Sphingobacterium faecium]|uniref:hypothetical protein n=1 Tax=Sphingobacterium faecium TaxID=34087 RepID=UPI00320A92B6